MQHTLKFSTEWGLFSLTEENGKITALSLLGEGEPDSTGETPLLKEGREQVEQYLNGERKQFTLPLEPKGTPFQQKVWAALRRIPYGETRTYQQIADMAGSPKACRAVGMANHNNPILLMMPCHRVIGSDGSLVGFAAGLDIKKKLLALEKEHGAC